MSDMKAKAEEIFNDVPFPEAEEPKGTDIVKQPIEKETKIQGLKKKLLKIQGLAVEKNAYNKFYSSSYTSLECMVEALKPFLDKHNILISHCTVAGNVVTTVTDTDSMEEIQSSLPLPEGVKPQELGSCITYFKRYNIGQIFNIVTDEDDDGNASSVEQGIKTITQQAPVKHNPAPAPMNQSAPLGNCPDCNSPMNPSKQGGGSYCYQCWKKSKRK